MGPPVPAGPTGPAGPAGASAATYGRLVSVGDGIRFATPTKTTGVTSVSESDVAYLSPNQTIVAGDLAVKVRPLRRAGLVDSRSVMMARTLRPVHDRWCQHDLQQRSRHGDDLGK